MASIQINLSKNTSNRAASYIAIFMLYFAVPVEKPATVDFGGRLECFQESGYGSRTMIPRYIFWFFTFSCGIGI